MFQQSYTVTVCVKSDHYCMLHQKIGNKLQDTILKKASDCQNGTSRMSQFCQTIFEKRFLDHSRKSSAEVGGAQ